MLEKLPRMWLRCQTMRRDKRRQKMKVVAFLPLLLQLLQTVLPLLLPMLLSLLLPMLLSLLLPMLLSLLLMELKVAKPSVF